jgi:tetratricopeptide (TPR) repeat protein
MALLWLRIVFASGVLEEIATGWALQGDLRRLPNTRDLGEAVAALTTRLSSSTRTFLRLAAHFGSDVPTRLFHHVPALAPELIGTTLQEAQDVGLIVVADAGAHVSFKTRSLRQVCAAMKPERGAPSGTEPKLLAEALLRHKLDDVTQWAELLAIHGRFGAVSDAAIAGCAASAAYHAASGHRALANDSFRRALAALYKTIGRDEGAAESTARVCRMLRAIVEWTALEDPISAADFPLLILRDIPPELAAVDRAEVERARGRVLTLLRRFSDAEKAFDAALLLCPETTNAEVAAATYASKASLYEGRNELEMAVAHLVRALELVEGKELHDRDLPWSTWHQLGRLYHRTVGFDQARATLSRAFQEATKVRSLRGVAEVTDTGAKFWAEAGDLDAACAAWDLAADHWVRWGDSASAAQSLHQASVALAKALRVEEAWTRAQRALQHAEKADWSAGMVSIKKLVAVLDARR